MSIEIRKLTPELVEDWLGYFDGIAFGDHGEWALCYCLEGHMTRQANEELKDPAQRREHARQLILAGKMQGYLAYDGDTVAGWCNANDRENYTRVAEMFEFSKYEAPKRKTKSVYCFLVAAAYRGQGIATLFLDRVCADAKAEGYEYVEAYPFGDENFAFQFHGTTKMYLKNGFNQVADFGFVHVMEKKL